MYWSLQSEVTQSTWSHRALRGCNQSKSRSRQSPRLSGMQKMPNQVPDRPQRCRPRGAPLPSRPSADRQAVFVLPRGSWCWLMVNMRIRLPVNKSLRRLYFKRLLAQIGLCAQARGHPLSANSHISASSTGQLWMRHASVFGENSKKPTLPLGVFCAKAHRAAETCRARAKAKPQARRPRLGSGQP